MGRQLCAYSSYQVGLTMPSHKAIEHAHPWNLCVRKDNTVVNIQLRGTSQAAVTNQVLNQIRGAQIISCERATTVIGAEKWSPAPPPRICGGCLSKLATPGNDKCENCQPRMCAACETDIATVGELCYECHDALLEHPTIQE